VFDDHQEPSGEMRQGTALSDRAVRWIRTASASAGVLMIASGLLADRVGLSAGGAVSRNQVLVMAVGLVLFAGGVLGRRFPGAWRGVAMLFLNCVFAILVLEVASIAVIKIWGPDELDVTVRKTLNARLLQNQVTTVDGEYYPFLVFRACPDPDGPETTDSDGNRITPGASTAPDAFEVWLFGGSAMWGCNVPDSATIPAILQDTLRMLVDGPVRVRNLSQVSWVSTQELIQLVLMLRNHPAPDVVVFYDGFNEVSTAYQTGIAGTHYNYEEIATRVEGGDILEMDREPFLQLARRSNTWLLLWLLGVGRGGWIEPESIDCYARMGIPAESLARGVVDVYLGNLGIASSLGAQYGFSTIFFWQPSVWTGEKELTGEERLILGQYDPTFPAASDPAFSRLYGECYEEMMERTRGTTVTSLAGLFDSTGIGVYNDPYGCHLNETGNRMAAYAILGKLVESGAVGSFAEETSAASGPTVSR
jgi:hypothetical protein